MILKKYLSWLSSTATLIVLGSLVLPKGLMEIADWFGPLLGPTFRPELTLIFLVAGPSLTYTPLLMTWVAAGVVGGFFARGVLRSMASGTLSTITVILLIVGNGFVIFTGLGRLLGGLSGFNIPPAPPGSSLTDILSEPLVGQGIGALASGGGLNPLSILQSIARNILLNHSIYAASFIISGFLFSKIRPGNRSRIAKVGNPTRRLPTSEPTVRQGITVLAILALVIAGLFMHAGFAQGPQSSGGTSGEQLALTLQQDGTLKTIYSTNVSSFPGVPTDYTRNEFQGLMGGFLFAFNGSVDLGQSRGTGSGGSLSFLIPLLPPNGFLAVYAVPDSSTGKTRADVLASEFSQGFGVGLRSSVSMMLPSFGGQQSSGIYIAIYSGDGQAAAIGIRALSLVQGTGVGSILTPQKLFVSQFGVQAGFINFNLQNTTGTPILVPSVRFTADLTPLGNFYGHGNFTLGIRETFGTQGTIGSSSMARSTSLQLGFPANFTVTGYRPINATLNNAQGQLTYSMNLTAVPISNMYVNFTGTFPQRVSINRQLNPQPPLSGGATVTEKITITNLGNETIRGVVVSEKRLFQTYPTLQLLSPSQNVSLGDIAPQTSATATIQFKIGSDGVYTLSPVDATYVDHGQMVSKTSNVAYLQSSFSYIFYLQELVRGTTPYSYLFLLLISLPPILQIPRLLGRSRAGRKQYAPVPVAMGNPPNPGKTQ